MLDVRGVCRALTGLAQAVDLLHDSGSAQRARIRRKTP